jgi:hypothetical protein
MAVRPPVTTKGGDWFAHPSRAGRSRRVTIGKGFPTDESHRSSFVVINLSVFYDDRMNYSSLRRDATEERLPMTFVRKERKPCCVVASSQFL